MGWSGGAQAMRARWGPVCHLAWSVDVRDYGRLLGVMWKQGSGTKPGGCMCSAGAAQAEGGWGRRTRGSIWKAPAPGLALGGIVLNPCHSSIPISEPAVPTAGVCLARRESAGRAGPRPRCGASVGVRMVKGALGMLLPAVPQPETVAALLLPPGAGVLPAPSGVLCTPAHSDLMGLGVWRGRLLCPFRPQWLVLPAIPVSLCSPLPLLSLVPHLCPPPQSLCLSLCLPPPL